MSDCLLCVRLLLFKKFLFSLSKIYPPYGGSLVENSQTGMVVNSYEKVHFHMKTLPLIHFVNFFVQTIQIVDTFLCNLHYFMREKVYHTTNNTYPLFHTLFHNDKFPFHSFFIVNPFPSSILAINFHFPFSFSTSNFPFLSPFVNPSFPLFYFPQSLYFQYFHNLSLYLPVPPSAPYVPCLLSLACLSCLAAVTVSCCLLSLRCIIVLFI